jgi:hypothetical protein
LRYGYQKHNDKGTACCAGSLTSILTAFPVAAVSPLEPGHCRHDRSASWFPFTTRGLQYIGKLTVINKFGGALVYKIVCPSMYEHEKIIGEMYKYFKSSLSILKQLIVVSARQHMGKMSDW